jgi:hypothetical protein
MQYPSEKKLLTYVEMKKEPNNNMVGDIEMSECTGDDSCKEVKPVLKLLLK